MKNNTDGSVDLLMEKIRLFVVNRNIENIQLTPD